MKAAFLDFETNGKDSSCSVIEAMFIKITYNKAGDILNKEKFHRFYFPIEEFNFSAFMAHNISLDKIKKERDISKATYPEFFKDDKEVLTWLNDVDILVAHNIAFDYKFLPEMLDKALFCTMKSSKDVVKATNINGNIKNPTLQEACAFFQIDFDSSQAHGAEYDTEKMAELFMKLKDINIVPFFDQSQKNKKSKNAVEIRTKISDVVKQITGHKIMMVEGFSFIISNSHIFDDTGGVDIYELSTGNFFTVIDYSDLSTNKVKELKEEDFKKIEAKIEFLINNIGKDNLKSIIDDFTKENGIIQQKTLFDF